MRAGEIRPGGDGLVKTLQRFRLLLQLLMGDTKIGERWRVIAAQRQCAPDQLDRIAIGFLLHGHHAAKLQCVEIARIARDDAFIFAPRFLQIALLLQGERRLQHGGMRVSGHSSLNPSVIHATKYDQVALGACCCRQGKPMQKFQHDPRRDGCDIMRMRRFRAVPTQLFQFA